MRRSKMTPWVAAASLAFATHVTAAPFGGEDDVAFAGKLWDRLEARQLVGPGAVMSTPYQGQPPHGAVLDTIDATVTLDGHTGTVIIKRNYGGEGVSEQAVAEDPGTWLKAVTVMFRRPGYDADHRDWFWVKYAPDGGILTNPKGMSLAGRIGKGMDKGCIACHKAAPGGDLVFNHDRFVR